MRANKRIFWISVISFIISVLILVGAVILKYELHKCCIEKFDEVIEIIKIFLFLLQVGLYCLFLRLGLRLVIKEKSI